VGDQHRQESCVAAQIGEKASRGKRHLAPPVLVLKETQHREQGTRTVGADREDLTWFAR